MGRSQRGCTGRCAKRRSPDLSSSWCLDRSADARTLRTTTCRGPCESIRSIHRGTSPRPGQDDYEPREIVETDRRPGTLPSMGSIRPSPPSTANRSRPPDLPSKGLGSLVPQRCRGLDDGHHATPPMLDQPKSRSMRVRCCGRPSRTPYSTAPTEEGAEESSHSVGRTGRVEPRRVAGRQPLPANRTPNGADHPMKTACSKSLGFRLASGAPESR